MWKSVVSPALRRKGKMGKTDELRVVGRERGRSTAVEFVRVGKLPSCQPIDEKGNPANSLQKGTMTGEDAMKCRCQRYKWCCRESCCHFTKSSAKAVSNYKQGSTDSKKNKKLRWWRRWATGAGQESELALGEIATLPTSSKVIKAGLFFTYHIITWNTYCFTNRGVNFCCLLMRATRHAHFFLPQSPVTRSNRYFSA